MSKWLVKYNNGILYNHPYANCHLEVVGNFIAFVSYGTPVLFFKRDSKEIYVKFDKNGRLYSTSTARQITWALRELTNANLSTADLYSALKVASESENLSQLKYLEVNNREVGIRVTHKWSY